MHDIKNVVNKVLEQIHTVQPSHHTTIQETWVRVVGPQGIKHTAIAGYSDGAVMINVDSSLWLYQMNTKRHYYLAKLAEVDSEIKGIYFKIGKVT